MSGRGVTFELEEAETLVELWADEEVQKKFCSMVHNGVIWDDLAKKFNAQYPDKPRTGAQLKTKIKALKKWYRDFKKGQGKSGSAGEKDHLWDLIDSVEGGKELTCPTHTGDTTLLAQQTDQNRQKENEADEHADEDMDTVESLNSSSRSSHSGSSINQDQGKKHGLNV